MLLFCYLKLFKCFYGPILKSEKEQLSLIPLTHMLQSISINLEKPWRTTNHFERKKNKHFFLAFYITVIVLREKIKILESIAVKVEAKPPKLIVAVS